MPRYISNHSKISRNTAAYIDPATQWQGSQRHQGREQETLELHMPLTSAFLPHESPGPELTFKSLHWAEVPSTSSLSFWIKRSRSKPASAPRPSVRPLSSKQEQPQGWKKPHRAQSRVTFMPPSLTTALWAPLISTLVRPTCDVPVSHTLKGPWYATCIRVSQHRECPEAVAHSHGLFQNNHEWALETQSPEL